MSTVAKKQLSAVVEKPRAEAAIGALRAEGVYDDGRSVYECGADTVAIPVTRPPETTDVLEVVEEAGEPRLRTLADHLRDRGWSEDDLDRAPGSWAVIGSVILVDVGDSPRPDEVGDALLAMHGSADTVLAREDISGPHREPDVTVIAGEGDTETVHREHGTVYALDLAAVMFSPGNKAERARMGEAVDDGERVLDMFAGIGYFTLPMARSGARVTAIERNPAAFQYLVENVVRNGVTERVETYRADCRDVVAGGLAGTAGDGGRGVDPSDDGHETDALDDGHEADASGDGHGVDLSDGILETDPSGGDHEANPPFVFDRVVMGYYDAHEYLDSALAALGDDGILHMHEATPEGLVPDRPVDRLREAAADHRRTVEVLDVRRVKGYSEGVAHVVVDARLS